MVERPEPTRLDRRNGWDDESLVDYVEQRKIEQTQALDFQSRPQRKRNVANSRYQPKRWRG